MGFLDSSGSRDPDRCSSIPNLGIQALNQILAENVWGEKENLGLGCRISTSQVLGDLPGEEIL